MTGKEKTQKGEGRKISRKKHARGEYKWAKVLGWRIDHLEKRIEKIEKAIKLICEKLSIDIEQGET